MQVLFVCKWNQGRSQIAAALFNKYSTKHTATSAGTVANEFPGVTLQTCAPLTVQALKEWQIDISQKQPRRLTPEIAAQADKIVALIGKNDLPDYLRKNNDIIYWPIGDPEGQDYPYHIRMRDEIDRQIKILITTFN